MSNYHLLKIKDVADIVAAEVATAKSDGSYAGNERSFDQKMMGVLQPLAENAAVWTRENADLADRQRRECQSRVKAAEALIKQREFSAREATAIVQFEKIVNDRLAEVSNDNSDLTSALAPQYRKDGWILSARGALSDDRELKALQDARGEQIKFTTGVIQLTRRMQEYSKRMLVLRKEAKIRIADGKKMAKIIKEAQRVMADMATGKEKVDELVYKCGNSIGNVKAEKKRKTAMDANMLKMYNSYLAKFDASGKEIRGQLKTMEGQLAMVNKYRKSFNGLDSYIKTELTTAAKDLKDAKGLHKAFDKDVGDCEKIMKAINKL